jgi:putative membrane protein
MLAVFCWAIFLISLVTSINCKQNSKTLAILSFVFMLIVLFVGTKLMLAYPGVAKSGMWIHTKLSIDILAMVINIYLVYVVFKRKNLSKFLSDIIFWFLILIFIGMYYLTLFKPF